MSQDEVERRLTTILATDVVGYSRLMGEDEAGTLATLKAHRRELIEPKAAQYHGRTIKLMGDGTLMEFASVVDAVAFAVEVQCAMRKRNRAVPEDRQITYRIGINVGDIIVEGEDIYGDGVNVAARLESLAEPGGICIRRNVRNQVRDKLDIDFEDLGEVEVKNIARPMRVFSVVLDEKADALLTPVVEMPVKAAPSRRPQIAVALVVSVLAIGGLVWWQPWAPEFEPASVEKMALPLPDKPSIAVLPFNNMSDDPGQAYFADGMTEDLITDLSKISGLFVISRNSTFTYKGQPVKVREVAEELGVRYVVEGSVRRVGDQVRINVQLIDALSGYHLWADRYDGSLSDIFALQDNVIGQIVAALAVKLTAGERSLQAKAETENAEAYDAFLRGWAYYRRNTPDDFAEAIPYLEQAVALDPNYSRAFAALAAIHWTSLAKDFTSRGGRWSERLGLSHQGARLQATKYLREATKNPVPLAHQVASGVQTFQGRHEAAVAEARRAIELDANDPIGYEALATALIYAGRPAEGADAIRKAMRLDPYFPSAYLVWLGLAQFGTEQFEAAAESLRRAAQRNPDDDIGLILLAAAQGHLGREEQAMSAVSALNTLRAKRGARLEEARAKGIEIGIDVLLAGPYTLKDVDLWPFKERADRERLRAGLEKAGVPAIAEVSAESPTEVAGATTVDAAAAKLLFDQGVAFVDVRNESHWNLGHIPGAVLLNFKSDFSEAGLLAVVARDQAVVIYCEGPKCLRSSKACVRAVAWGFEKVYYLREGFPGWKAAGYPTAVNN